MKIGVAQRHTHTHTPAGGKEGTVGGGILRGAPMDGMELAGVDLGRVMVRVVCTCHHRVKGEGVRV